MRHTLIAGIACLTLALSPLKPVHAGEAGPRPVSSAQSALIGIGADPAKDDRRPPASAILPRHGIGRIDRNTADPGPEGRPRRVNNRHGRHAMRGRGALRQPAQHVETPQFPAPPAFAVVSAPKRHQERTVVQR